MSAGLNFSKGSMYTFASYLFLRLGFIYMFCCYGPFLVVLKILSLFNSAYIYHSYSKWKECTHFCYKVEIKQSGVVVFLKFFNPFIRVSHYLRGRAILPYSQWKQVLRRAASSAAGIYMPKLEYVGRRPAFVMLDDFTSLENITSSEEIATPVEHSIQDFINKLHAVDISHGDIKPQNILVRKVDASVRVIDFDDIQEFPNSVEYERDVQAVSYLSRFLQTKKRVPENQ